MKILVAGGSGFIGSALVHLLIAESEHLVVNVDKLTYAANPLSLTELEGHPRYVFVHQDICDGDCGHLVDHLGPGRNGVLHPRETAP